MGSNNLHGYGSIEDKQIEKQTLWEATTYTVMEVLMTNRETDYGSNNLHGYGSIEDKQIEKQTLWEATTYTVVEVLKTNKQTQTDNMGSNNLRGYGSRFRQSLPR